MTNHSRALLPILISGLWVLPAPTFGQDEPDVPGINNGTFKITYYGEPDHELLIGDCFLFTRTGGVEGQPKSGKWISLFFEFTAGEWIQEGDHVRIYGYEDGFFGLGLFGSIQSTDQMAGEFVRFFAIPSEFETRSAGSWVAKRVLRRECLD